MHLKDMGQVLKNIRLKKNISPEKIFKKTRIHPNIINAIEEGTLTEILAKPYARGFLKKYAEFLGANSKQLLRDFDALEVKDAKQVLELGARNMLRDKKRPWALPVSATATIFITALLLLFTLRAVLNLFVKKETRAKKPAPTVEARKKSPVIAASASGEPAKKEDSFTLALKAHGDVWARLTKDGQKVFEGMLAKGSVEKWNAEKRIDIRCGKAEALELILDGESKGIAGEGVKNIAVTKGKVEIR